MSVRDCAKRGSAAEQSNGMTTRLAKEPLACKSDAKVVGCSRNRLRSRSAGYRQSRWFSNVFLTLLELAFDHPSRRKKSGRALRQKRTARWSLSKAAGRDSAREVGSSRYRRSLISANNRCSLAAGDSSVWRTSKSSTSRLETSRVLLANFHLYVGVRGPNNSGQTRR